MKLILMLLVISAVALVIPATTSAQNPDDDPFNWALTELKAGNTDKAIAALTEAIKKNPDNADAYLFRSSLRMTSGDTPGALADVNKTIQLKPEMGQAYHERAILRLIARDLAGGASRPRCRPCARLQRGRTLFFARTAPGRIGD